MTLTYQNPVLANVVLEALTSSVSKETISYQAAVAYVTREGAKTLIDALSERVGTKWATIPKTIVTCFDFGHTEPEALEYLKANGFEVRISNLGADGAIRLRSNPSSFHPKIYMAPAAGVVHAVVGSANLSRRALTINTEAITISELDLDDASDVWGEIIANSIELTPAILKAYKDIRPQQRTMITDEPIVPKPASPRAYPVFRSAVEAGQVNPSEYQAFWVEVGGASGGSGNQLELPRRGHRFFGYRFDNYDDNHHLIGEPTLMANVGSWTRKLTWHGNNKMERINLPTTAQSELEYSHQVVLFQRAGNSFEITVADPNSIRARRWREESAAAGTLYRFSGGSNRMCGLI